VEVTEDQSRSRREFLATMAALLASGITGSLLEADAKPAAAAKPKYKLGPWTGDNFNRGHQLRDGSHPGFPKEAERTVDFAIIGGGIAGLTTAYYLRDHDFLLLEQYDELGGQARGGSYRGIDYSIGSAYMGSNSGMYGELFRELNIAPVEVPTTKNAWYWEDRWFPGIESKDQSIIYKELKRMLADCRAVWKVLPENDDACIINTDDLRKLDNTLFANYLKGFNPKFVALMDSYCRSACCGGIQQVSALAGYWLAQDLVSPSFVFKGGNPAISRALVKRLNATGTGRLQTGTFVWSVEPITDGMSVVYSDKSGQVHRVNCKHAIITAPPLVALRILPGADDQTKALLLSCKLGSYLVANLGMKKKIFTGSYDNWVGAPFTFTDVVIAETPYLATKSYKPSMGSVLTIYQPYAQGSPGRAQMLVGDRQEFATSIVSQMKKLVPQLDANLEEVNLTRWGHAMVVLRPTTFAKLEKLRAMDPPNYTLAHNSIEGFPSAESAIRAARRAANRALKVKA
jgi:protoporphyrinogen oxidase